MKRSKGILVLLLVCTLILSLAVGCGNSAGNQAGTSTAAQESNAQTSASAQPTVNDPFKDHVEFSMAIWDIGNSIVDGVKDPMYDAITKKLNITIKPENVTWDDYTQKIQMWAASNQLPDLFAVDFAGTSSFNKFIDDKLVKALPDDMSNYPELKKVLDTPESLPYKYKDGKFYCMPRVNVSSPDMVAGARGMYIRKDWMNSVGITKDPENLDELIALLKAFVAKDPGKNGKDTIGLTAYNTTALLDIMLSYEAGIATGVNNWVKEDGKWIPAEFSKNAAQGVLALRKLFDEGCLDKDIALIKGNDGVDKFVSGKAGALLGNTDPAYYYYTIDKNWEKVSPDKKITDCVEILKPWKAPDGNYYRDTEMTNWSESYINSNVDDLKMDRILRFLDFFLTDEGLSYIRYGIEGVDYTRDGDNIKTIDTKDDKGNVLSLGQKYTWEKGLYCISSWDSDHAYSSPGISIDVRNQCNDFLKWMQQNGKPVETDFRLNFLDYPSKSKATANIADDVIKAVLSKDTAAAWDSIIKVHMNAGYKQVIDDVNAAAASAGIN